MGIPRFFTSLTGGVLGEHTKSILETHQLKTAVIPVCDHFHLDANSIVHNAAQRVYGYGGYDRPHRKAEGLNPQEKERLLFFEVGNYIDVLVKLVRPRKSLHIMFDGVCPVAKQQQQMRRRYRSAMESSSGSEFDSNCITPGTAFMSRLSEYMHFFIRLRLNREEYGSIQIYYSDSNRPGEGEHKIADWIRNNVVTHKESHCIYGLDADLIVISTALPAHEIFLLRENVFAPLHRMEFHIFHVRVFREVISGYLRHLNNDVKQAIQDFVVMTFLVGNDFLPCVSGLQDLKWSLPTLFEAYREIKKPLYVDGQVSVQTLGLLCERVSGRLAAYLVGEALKQYTYPDETLQDCCTFKVEKGVWMASVNYELWNEKMCQKLPTKIDQSCSDYLSVLNWVADYYFNGIQDWRFNCTFDYAPTLATLTKHLPKKYKYQKHVSSPTRVETLLLCVTPPKSDYLIPENIRHLKLVRKDVHIVREGTSVEWGGHVHMKPISNQEIDKIESQLPPLDNEIRPLCFVPNGTLKTYRFTNDYGYVNNCRVLTRLC